MVACRMNGKSWGFTKQIMLVQVLSALQTFVFVELSSAQKLMGARDALTKMCREE